MMTSGSSGISWKDPDHPIIDKPWEFQIADFRCFAGLDGTEPFIDMALVRGSEVRRLRFWSPQELSIECGFPMPTGGMEILDVSARKLERLKVRVRDFEANWGKAEFWAREVIDLDQSDPGAR